MNEEEGHEFGRPSSASDQPPSGNSKFSRTLVAISRYENDRPSIMLVAVGVRARSVYSTTLSNANIFPVTLSFGTACLIGV
jgi:hypothetical protein